MANDETPEKLFLSSVAPSSVASTLRERKRKRYNGKNSSPTLLRKKLAVYQFRVIPLLLQTKVREINSLCKKRLKIKDHDPENTSTIQEIEKKIEELMHSFLDLENVQQDIQTSEVSKKEKQEIAHFIFRVLLAYESLWKKVQSKTLYESLLLKLWDDHLSQHYESLEISEKLELLIEVLTFGPKSHTLASAVLKHLTPFDFTQMVASSTSTTVDNFVERLCVRLRGHCTDLGLFINMAWQSIIHPLANLEENLLSREKKLQYLHSIKNAYIVFSKIRGMSQKQKACSQEYIAALAAIEEDALLKLQPLDNQEPVQQVHEAKSFNEKIEQLLTCFALEEKVSSKDKLIRPKTLLLAPPLGESYHPNLLDLIHFILLDVSPLVLSEVVSQIKLALETYAPLFVQFQNITMPMTLAIQIEPQYRAALVKTLLSLDILIEEKNFEMGTWLYIRKAILKQALKHSVDMSTIRKEFGQYSKMIKSRQGFLDKRSAKIGVFQKKITSENDDPLEHEPYNIKPRHKQKNAALISPYKNAFFFNDAKAESNDLFSPVFSTFTYPRAIQKLLIFLPSLQPIIDKETQYGLLPHTLNFVNLLAAQSHDNSVWLAIGSILDQYNQKFAQQISQRIERRFKDILNIINRNGDLSDEKIQELRTTMMAEKGKVLLSTSSECINLGENNSALIKVLLQVEILLSAYETQHNKSNGSYRSLHTLILNDAAKLCDFMASSDEKNYFQEVIHRRMAVLMTTTEAPEDTLREIIQELLIQAYEEQVNVLIIFPTIEREIIYSSPISIVNSLQELSLVTGKEIDIQKSEEILEAVTEVCNAQFDIKKPVILLRINAEGECIECKIKINPMQRLEVKITQADSTVSFDSSSSITSGPETSSPDFPKKRPKKRKTQSVQLEPTSKKKPKNEAKKSTAVTHCNIFSTPDSSRAATSKSAFKPNVVI